MPKQKKLSVKSLKLDLTNFRALPQANEIEEIRILYYSAPEWFEGLLFSIAKEGYSSLESIGVLEKNGKYIVLEGNRRVSIFKLLLGVYSYNRLAIKMSKRAQEVIESISSQWRTENSKVPCIVFNDGEEEILREIVRRTHGIDNKAARKTWESISKARESRDQQGNSEPELDLIEAILKKGAHHSEEQAKAWLSNIKFSLFQEIARELSKRIKISVEDIRDRYAANDLNAHTIDALERIVAQIGQKKLKFSDIRKGNRDFYFNLHLQEENITPGYQFIEQTSGGNSSSEPPTEVAKTTTQPAHEQGGTAGPTPKSPAPVKRKDTSPLPGTIRHCEQLIGSLSFASFPKSKDKLKVLQKEMKIVNTDDTPNALASLFRSLLDLTFTEYCEINKLQPKKDNLLSKIKIAHDHILNSTADRVNTERDLTQPLTALIDQYSCISTAALNVIIHRKGSVASPGDLRLGIYRVIPLLRAIGM